MHTNNINAALHDATKEQPTRHQNLVSPATINITASIIFTITE